MVGGTVPQAGDPDGLKRGRRSKLETVGIFSPFPLCFSGTMILPFPATMERVSLKKGFLLSFAFFLRYFVTVRRSCGDYRKRGEERMAESSEEEGATELANMLSQLRARVYVS